MTYLDRLRVVTEGLDVDLFRTPRAFRLVRAVETSFRRASLRRLLVFSELEQGPKRRELRRLFAREQKGENVNVAGVSAVRSLDSLAAFCHQTERRIVLAMPVAPHV